MPAQFISHEKILLRDSGHDEKWLQGQIAANPKLLGLGDLTLFRKELKQSSGGRLDMVLSDPDTETMYEVEIMLGATDPHHIIRTIEYWDIESRRYPNREHRAVIVAEEITNRFFNVIWLLNRSLPIIAIQLDVLKISDSFLLHFTKILDIYENPEQGEEQPDVISDRGYWEERSSPAAMTVFDRFISLVRENGINLRLNYRQDGIALAGKWNFARLIPRSSGYCLLKVGNRFPQDVLLECRSSFEEAGIAVRPLAEDRFSIQLDNQTIERGAAPLIELVRRGVTLNE